MNNVFDINQYLANEVAEDAKRAKSPIKYMVKDSASAISEVARFASFAIADARKSYEREAFIDSADELVAMAEGLQKAQAKLKALGLA